MEFVFSRGDADCCQNSDLATHIHIINHTRNQKGAAGVLGLSIWWPSSQSGMWYNTQLLPTKRPQVRLEARQLNKNLYRGVEVRL